MASVLAEMARLVVVDSSRFRVSVSPSTGADVARRQRSASLRSHQLSGSSADGGTLWALPWRDPSHSGPS